MQLVVNNLVSSKARPMVLLRYLLGVLLATVSLVRLRLIIQLLGSTETYKIRDTLTYYLMAKAIASGDSPYTPVNELAMRYFGFSQSMHHPALSAPFTGIISLPLLFFPVEKAYIAWFIFEMICLVLLAILLSVLIKGRADWRLALLFWLVLLSWYPVMVELLLGQLTILLTLLLLAALLAWKQDKKVLAGILTGVTVAIKMYTWPLVFYYAVKKEWRILISACATIALINIAALMVIGIGPFTDYYLKVTQQSGLVYRAYMRNYSIWSIGYRLFEGTHGTSADYLSAPPLVNLPQIAFWVSAVLAVAFLLVTVLWASRSRDKNFAYSIMICTVIAVSPITWDHYYLMLIIPLAILAKYLLKDLSQYRLVILFFILAVLLFTLNEYIGPVLFALNDVNQISFASSLLETLPILELIALTILLWRAGVYRPNLEGEKLTR